MSEATVNKGELAEGMSEIERARNIAALLSGLLFGLGVTISQMTNPAKVLGFFDLAGNWDPSLAFVMAFGLLVTAVGYRQVWKRPQPRFDTKFHLPTSTIIDRPLILGALLFGLGWGITGLCPGPAIASVVIGGVDAWVFFVAMIAGMWVQARTR